MTNKFRLSVAALSVTTLVLGQQVGSVSASGSFDMGQTHVPASAARSLPLSSCQPLRSLDSTLVLMLGASRIRVDKQSRIMVEAKGTELWVYLAEGSIDFLFVPGSPIHLVALGKLIETDGAAEGSIAIQPGEKVRVVPRKGTLKALDGTVHAPGCGAGGSPPEFSAASWVADHPVVVIAGAIAAAGMAAGIVVTRQDETPVSATRP